MKCRKKVKCPYCGCPFTDIEFVELHCRISKSCRDDYFKEINHKPNKRGQAFKRKYQ